ncbi:MAG: prealbumin-like fold domain-containing protein [Hyphomicrobiaceae bacterium]
MNCSRVRVRERMGKLCVLREDISVMCAYALHDETKTEAWNRSDRTVELKQREAFPFHLYAFSTVVSLFLLIALFLTTGSAYAQQAPGCRTAGNNIFCDSCAAAQSAPIGDRQVLLSPNVTPGGGTQGSNNSFCRIENLAPGDSLNLTVTDTGSQNITMFEVDYNRVGAMPASLMPSSQQDVNVSVPGGSDTQSFAHSEAGPADTSVRATIADTQPSGQQQPSVSATVTCSCRPAPPPRATLTLVKNVNNNNNGMAADTDFTLSFSGPSNGSGAEGDAAITNASVLTGNYTLSETVLAGYTQTGLTCNGLDQNLNDGLDLQANEDVTCTFTNNDLPPATATLTLEKVVNNNFGGTAMDSDFTLSFAGPSVGSGVESDAAITNATVLPGAYTFSESGPQGYNLSSFQCVVNQGNPITVVPATGLTLAQGDNVTCTFTNNDIAPPRATLTLVKNVNNNNNGMAADTDFTLSFAGPSNGSGVEGDAAITNASVLTGNYTLSETVLAGYTQTGLTCNGLDQNLNDGLDLQDNEDVTCTFTNNDLPPATATLTLEKVVNNNFGGTAMDSDFTLSFAGPSVGSGVETDAAITNATVLPGAYTFSESGPQGYNLSSFQCVVNQGNPITVVPATGLTLAQGDNVTCTFTNNDVAPPRTSLSITKTVNGADKDFAFDGTQPFGNFSLSNGQTNVQNNINPGIFVITEGPDVDYTLDGATCTGNGLQEIFDANARQLIVEVQDGEDVECTFINTQIQRTGSLTIEKRVIGANASFGFSGTTPFGNFSLSNGQTTTRGNLAPGNFIITETSNPLYTLNSITCVGNSNAPVIDLNAGTLTIFVPAGDDVICTFENGQVRDPRMEEETRRFIHRRVDNLLTHKPDRARMLRRLQDAPPKHTSMKDGGTLKHSNVGSQKLSNGSGVIGTVSGQGNPRAMLGGPVDPRSNNVRSVIEGTQTSTVQNPFFDAIAGQLAQVGFGQTNFKFGTSLSELRSKAAAYEAERQKKNLAAAGLEFSGGYGLGRALEPRTGLDVWVEGQFSRYHDNIGGVQREGDFRILYVGADYVLYPGVLIGVLAQIDDTREDIAQTDERGEIEGTGWMAGPYIGARLYKNLYLDVRAAWGSSDNDILLEDTELGLRTGSFDTNRWLVSGTLSGHHTRGAWRFSPQLELAYGHEEYDTYQNSLGLTVLGGEASIGRLSGTFEVGYQWRTSDGLSVEPHASITGIWNFDSDSLVINNTLFATDETRARVEGGVTLTAVNGWSVRAAGNYDGIGGDDFESYGGSVWISVPLN